jgi:hypothetical protein
MHVLVVAVDGGFVVDVLLDDAVSTGTGVITLGAGGNGRAPGQFTVLEEIHHLLAQIDDDAGPALHLIGIPEGAITLVEAKETPHLAVHEAGSAWDLTGDDPSAKVKAVRADAFDRGATAQ